MHYSERRCQKRIRRNDDTFPVNTECADDDFKGCRAIARRNGVFRPGKFARLFLEFLSKTAHRQVATVEDRGHALEDFRFVGIIKRKSQYWDIHELPFV